MQVRQNASLGLGIVYSGKKTVLLSINLLFVVVLQRLPSTLTWPGRNTSKGRPNYHQPKKGEKM